MAKVDCTFDELSYNVIHNRILKSTLESLLKSDELRKDVREQLRLSYLKLPADIEMLNVRKEHFRSLRFHRNQIVVEIARGFVAQQIQQQHLHLSEVKQIHAAHHMGNPLADIVDG